ncbi:unnamed protein product [Symbiodinium sp. CCMP2592]|nr:unnamed protein product [Symbiodinium sp. CCMP2592]
MSSQPCAAFDLITSTRVHGFCTGLSLAHRNADTCDAEPLAMLFNFLEEKFGDALPLHSRNYCKTYHLNRLLVTSNFAGSNSHHSNHGTVSLTTNPEVRDHRLNPESRLCHTNLIVVLDPYVNNKRPEEQGDQRCNGWRYRIHNTTQSDGEADQTWQRVATLRQNDDTSRGDH